MARGRVEIKPNCDAIVAHLRGVVGEVSSTAQQKAAVASGVLLAHRAEGHSQILVERDGIDSVVTLSDERGQRAAAAIEYGNRYGGGNVKALDKAFGLRG
jgi:hypothetical protein